MKKIWIKIVVVAFVLFAALAGGGIYYISQKVKPEQLKETTLSALSDIFPGAVIALDSVDVSLGFVIKARMSNFSMKLKSSIGGDDLFRVDSIKVRIPLWAILIRGGTISFNVSSPTVLYKEKGVSNNWLLSMSGQKLVAPTTTSGGDASDAGASAEEAIPAIALPDFLAKSQLHVEFSDMKLGYELRDGTSGELKIINFLVKNLNLRSDTAFKLSSSFSMTSKKGEKTGFNILAIGHFNLNRFLKDGELETVTVLTVDDIALPSMPGLAVPRLKADINMKLDTKGVGSGKVTFDVDGVGKAATDVFFSRESVKISNLDASFDLHELASKFALTLPSMVSLKGSKLGAKGALSFAFTGDLNPNLEFTVSPPIAIRPVPGIDISAGAQGSFVGKKLDCVLSGSANSGDFSAKVSTNFDPMAPGFSIEKLNPIFVKLLASKVQLPKEVIQKLIYGSSPASAKPTASAEVGAKAAPTKSVPAIILPQMIADIDWSAVKIGNENFEGSFEIKTKGHTIHSEKGTFKFSKGQGRLEFDTLLGKNFSLDNTFDFKLDSLNLDALSPFLPPFMAGLTGVFNGQVKGTVGIGGSRDLRHDINVDVVAKDGAIKGLDISAHVLSVLESLPSMKGKAGNKDYKISNEFDEMLLKGVFRQDHFRLNNVFYRGIRNSSEVTATGDIYPLSREQKGQVDITFKDKTGKIGGQMMTHLKTDVLPVRLSGYQYDLKPDYGYTLVRLTKNLVDEQKDKIKEKAKEEIKKVQDAQINQLKDKLLNKDNAGKLLKGLFK